MSIKRYNFYSQTPIFTDESKEGDYVKYDDHEAIVKALNEDIANLRLELIAALVPDTTSDQQQPSKEES